MRFRIFAVLAALLFSPSANAAVVEEFKAVDWDGLAFTSDETGEFTHCSVYATYRNGSTLYISYEAAQSWYLSVSNDSWSLGEGGNFAIKFKVDRRGEIEGTGVALASNQIGLPIEADHPFISQLRRGRQLVITFQNNEYAFELSNSNRAMDAAQDCVRRHVAAGTRTPVISGKPEEQTAAPEPAPTPAPAPAPSPAPAPPPAEEETASESSDAVATGDQQEFGPWVVAATDDGAGTFVNCTAYGMYGDDQLILSLFPDGIWTFGLYRAAWTLDTNQTYYLWYNVDAPADAANVTKRPVEAAEKTRIFFEVSDLEDLMERIENGNTLNLQFRGLTGTAENYSYPLDRVTEAFAAVRDCIGKNKPVEGVSKEGSGAKEETATGPDQGTAEEATPEEPPATAEGEAGESVAPSERRELPKFGMTIVEEFDVPGWKAAAFSLDDGTFTHCAIKAEYQNGATFGVARAANGDMVLVIQHDDWSLEAGAWVPLSYKVQGATPLFVSGEGQAADENLIFANMGSGDELTATIAGATEMTIDAEGKNLAFDVSDIGPGITAIDACAERHAAAGSEPAPAPKPASKKAEAPPAPEPETETDVASTDTGAGSAAPAPSTETSAAGEEVALNATGSVGDIRTEAAGYTTAILFRAGYPNHVILGADAAVPGDVPQGNATWQLGEIVGSTRIVSAGSPQDIKSAIGDELVGKCGGVLTTQIVSSDATHMHFTLACGSGTPRITHYIVLPRDAGGSYVFALLGAGDDTAAAEIADRVYGIAAES